MTQPPPHRPAFRDPNRQGRAAQILIGLYALLDAVHAAVTLAEGPGHGMLLLANLNLPVLIALGAGVVTFLVWFQTSRCNAETLRPGTSAYTTDAAVWSWFAPPLLLWRPRRIALDVARAFRADGASDRTVLLVNLWWAAWLARLASWFGVTAESRYATVPVVLTESLDLVAAVLVILVVQRLTDAQNALLRPPVPPVSSAPAASESAGLAAEA
ncbi:DUF4328 domain-containing protein [Streptacidiphilus cavernicola]|uniref:DUF4328 domain-containing protein n=1 Tax=Streptacidiphilus cavernicola TaxID=3342716 RepID=A0ABV6VZ35_9ACTN